jgi:hypothetical protein
MWSKRIILGLVLLLFASILSGQIGIRAFYQSNHAPAWDDFFTERFNQETDVFSSSYTIAVDYWLRLPNHRLEFYPYLSYHRASSEFVSADITNVDLRQIGLGLYTHLYILDFIGDCECPTFSKQGGFFKKGFFIVGGLGADFSEKSFTGREFYDGNIDVKVSLGLGFDFGLSDLVTISPILQYQYHPSISWHEISTDFSNVESSLGQIQLGVRIGFRPDYTRGGRRF